MSSIFFSIFSDRHESFTNQWALHERCSSFFFICDTDFQTI